MSSNLFTRLKSGNNFLSGDRHASPSKCAKSTTLQQVWDLKERRRSRQDLNLRHNSSSKDRVKKCPLLLVRKLAGTIPVPAGAGRSIRSVVGGDTFFSGSFSVVLIKFQTTSTKKQINYKFQYSKIKRGLFL